MERALTDPVVSRLLSADSPFDAAVLDALSNVHVSAGLADASWVDIFERSYKVGRKRDIPGLIKLVEAMNDRQWKGLMAMLEGMGIEPSE